MNEQDLKEMIRSLLSELDTNAITEPEKEVQTVNSDLKAPVSNSVQPDHRSGYSGTIFNSESH